MTDPYDDPCICDACGLNPADRPIRSAAGETWLCESCLDDPETVYRATFGPVSHDDRPVHLARDILLPALAWARKLTMEVRHEGTGEIPEGRIAPRPTIQQPCSQLTGQAHYAHQSVAGAEPGKPAPDPLQLYVAASIVGGLALILGVVS